ncbi:MAG: hypothetical protein QM817_39220 [Archangium sp.]
MRIVLALSFLSLSGCVCTREEPCDAGTCSPGLVCSRQSAICRLPCAQGSDCPLNCGCVLNREGDGGSCEPTNINGPC